MADAPKDMSLHQAGIQHKPALAAKAQAHKEAALAGAAPTLRTVDVGVTGACNLRCRHCYAADLPSRDLVPLPALQKALARCREIGAFHFVLQGGEAITDMTRLEAIIASLAPEESYINVVSNGWDLSREMAAHLKGLGVDKITVSLDSSIPDEHDANRDRPGSHARAVKALETITGLGLHASFSTTITHDNLHGPGIQGLFAFAREKGIRMDIQVAAPIGRWAGQKQLCVTPEDAAFLQKAGEGLTDRQGRGLINRDVFPRFGRQGCPAAKEFLSISPSGHLFPCTFIHTSFGSVAERDVGEMREEMLRLPWFTGYHPVCLVGEDMDFIAQVLDPACKAVFPADAKAVYDFPPAQ